MNGVGLAVGSVALIAGALGAYLVLGPMREPPGLRSAPEAASSGAWEQGEDSDPGQENQDRSRVQAPSPLSDSGSDKTAMPQASPGGPTVTPRPFPLARDLPAGLERAEILRRFGAPAMHTTTVERGVPMETMVYLQREPESATFILLRGGRVASASTSGY